jgi:UDP:flavonoid glycosyltransferase YjiC (YdhE family)
MYVKGDRPRLMVSAGSRVSPDRDFDTLAGLVAKVSDLDVELLVAAPDEVAEKLRPLPDNVRAGWLPLDVLAPTCDLTVNHAGGNTVLGNMAHGVPQVLVPYLPYVVDYSQRLAAAGAAMVVDPRDDSAENVAAACRTVLGDPSYAQRARAIAAEMAALPVPADVVGTLVELAGR